MNFVLNIEISANAFPPRAICHAGHNEMISLWSYFPDESLITNVCLCNLLKRNSLACQPRS